jgi:hypothetical protein
LKKLLSFFSYLFHPIFVPVFGTLFYFLFSNYYFTTQQKYLILLQIGIITIIIPITFYYLLRSFGKVDSVMVYQLSQRKIPLLLQAILIFLLITKSITVEVIPELYYYFLGGLISTFLLLILLVLKIKASIHMVGISTLTVFVIALSFHSHSNAIYSIALLVAMNGIVATSRLELRAHTNKELLIGFFSGLLPQIILTCFWL